MPGLDPGINTNARHEEDELSGIGERKRRRPSDGYARQ
jgi:hypothetical protein